MPRNFGRPCLNDYSPLMPHLIDRGCNSAINHAGRLAMTVFSTDESVAITGLYIGLLVAAENFFV
jgi:hypothetical protein